MQVFSCSAPGAIAHQGAPFGTGDIFLDRVSCSGDEERLLDCSHNVQDINCTQSGGGAVSCAGRQRLQFSLIIILSFQPAVAANTYVLRELLVGAYASTLARSVME